MQRLFSTFAEGWPGAGLLLQRGLTSTIRLYWVATHLIEQKEVTLNLVSPLIAGIAGLFLLLGLWTPLAGITIAILGVWVFFAGSAHSLTAIIVAVLGATAR